MSQPPSIKHGRIVTGHSGLRQPPCLLTLQACPQQASQRAEQVPLEACVKQAGYALLVVVTVDLTLFTWSPRLCVKLLWQPLYGAATSKQHMPQATTWGRVVGSAPRRATVANLRHLGTDIDPGMALHMTATLKCTNMLINNRPPVVCAVQQVITLGQLLLSP